MPPPKPPPQWEVKGIAVKHANMAMTMERGWEPFAVTYHTAGLPTTGTPVIWYRRQSP